MRFGKAETNEKEVRGDIEGSKMPDVDRGRGVSNTIFHFPPRSYRARAASLRGFLQISSPVSSVSPARPAEVRWQLQLIAQARLVW